jgi:diguanylate cyclase (GGDEF)-like protein
MPQAGGWIRGAIRRAREVLPAGRGLDEAVWWPRQLGISGLLGLLALAVPAAVAAGGEALGPVLTEATAVLALVAGGLATRRRAPATGLATAGLLGAALLAGHVGDRLALGALAVTLLGAAGLYQQWAPLLATAAGTAALLVALDGHWPGTVLGGALLVAAVVANLAWWKLCERQSLYDPLTGLANRTLFHDRLQHALSLAARNPARVAVLFIDLDGFKLVNDSLGHAAGDEVLVVTARRLRAALRSSDTLARLGGDEFAALLEQLDDPLDALAVAERVDQSLRVPLAVHGRELIAGASIGVAFSSGSQADAGGLLHDADVAMYAAKRHGQGGYRVFAPTMQGDTVNRFHLLNDLQHATDRDELVVRYQPIVDLDSGAVASVEALVRWAHPTRGLLGPTDFIHAAEESGLIVPIGRWVLRHATRQAASWRQHHPDGPPLAVSVNVSSRQLHHPELVGEVHMALDDAGLDPASLILEFTESAVMDDSEANIARLHDLKRLGVRLALDDFGTGYSSLGYLRRFPVDTIKIDKSFTDDLPSGSNEAVLASTILHLAAQLDLAAVAEGIEHAEQAAWLRSHGCRWGQGYYYAEPLDPDDVAHVLDNGRICAPVPEHEPSVGPVAGAPRTAAASPENGGSGAGALPFVLIVDDNVGMVTVLQRLLERSGFRCDAAGTAADAWAGVGQASPDFALVDIRLPDGDGWGLIQRIRADERHHDLPIVVMTGLVDRATIDRATSLACAYLGKPFDGRSLLAALHHARATVPGSRAGRPR